MRIFNLLAPFTLFIWLLSALPANASSEIEMVLSLGPLPMSVEPMGDSAKADEMRRALVMQMSGDGMPDRDEQLQIFDQDLSWNAVTPRQFDGSGGPWLWMVHLATERFVRGHLEVLGLRSPEIWLDGKPHTPEEGQVELNLAQGTHTFWIYHHGVEIDASPRLAWQGQSDSDRVSTYVEPSRRVSARLLTNAETATDIALSPDGQYLALSFSSRDDAADLDLSRLEIRELETGRILQQWTGTVPHSLAWSPDSSTLAVREGNHLWLHDRSSGAARLLLANHENLGDWRWRPDGSSILFAWTEPFEAENEKRRRVRSLEDRWSTFRNDRQWFEVDADSGVIRPLTAGDRSINLLDVSQDGARLLLSERIIDYGAPPHSLWRLFTLDLSSLETEEIGRYRQMNAALFADDGYWLLAGPGFEQGDGATTADDLTPNEYDTQLYALSPDGERARSMSRDFDPALREVERLANGDLLFSVTRGEEVALVRFDAEDAAFEAVEIGLQVVEDFAVSQQDDPILIARGTDADAPQRVMRVDLASKQVSVVLDSRETQYDGVVFSEVRPWSFTNGDGDKIEGRYYLPPDFDPEASYPLIVYYYGGTTPVNRQFTGRYPFQLWAAKGYVVYVLQPRGTIGYGQRFSALHVNAWGRYTADDIIEGTDQFVAAHRFVDGERVGNIGASYGGFMTMYLATRTDRFAASISHAGISTLTSYWGEGWWGYGYSGIASKGSFPWNNPELYVDQSPIYAADRITTPLLLVTGDSDTNVPPGESDTMFTALKLLDREVELVEFPGQDHWILDREQRYVWWDTMLAWFDRWLKDQPEWWHHLYPETAPAE